MRTTFLQYPVVSISLKLHEFYCMKLTIWISFFDPIQHSSLQERCRNVAATLRCCMVSAQHCCNVAATFSCNIARGDRGNIAATLRQRCVQYSNLAQQRCSNVCGAVGNEEILSTSSILAVTISKKCPHLAAIRFLKAGTLNFIFWKHFKQLPNNGY